MHDAEQGDKEDGQYWNEQRMTWYSIPSPRAYPNSVVALSAKSMTNGSGDAPTMSTARAACTGQNHGGPECCGRKGTAPRVARFIKPLRPSLQGGFSELSMRYVLLRAGAPCADPTNEIKRGT
jgi:hypothetical protein